MEPSSSVPAEDRDPLPDASVPSEVPVPPSLPADPVAEPPLGEVSAPTPEPSADPVSMSEPSAPEPMPVVPSPLDLGDAAPEAVQAADLSAVEAKPSTEPAPATNLDLPSLELPHPVPPAAPMPSAPAAAAGGAYPMAPSDTGYAEDLARRSYGEPAAEPTPPAGAPYAASPYASAPGASAPYAEPQYAQPQFGGQPGYDQAAFGQQQYGQLVPAAQLSAADENTWATAAHWSTLVASLISLPFLGPLLVLLIQGPKSPRVRANAVESLNFDLTMLIGMLISFVLMVVLIGFITAPIIAVLWLVLKIVAAVQTSGGRDYRYPLTIRMVK